MTEASCCPVQGRTCMSHFEWRDRVINKATITRYLVVLSVAVIVSAGAATNAAAEGFISPFIGYNFSGDSGCPEITNCNDTRID